MKLANFEEFIEDKILERGFDYFVEERILSIAKIEKGYYRAVVEGSYDYIVEVWLGSGGKIININCDCPYDWGEFCKHQAAVLYALKDKGVKTGDLNLSENKKVKRSPRQNLKTILVNLGKDELMEIILKITQQYPELEKQLLFKYIVGAEEIATCKKLIREYINKAKYRGFIEWDKTDCAMRGAWRVLEKVRTKSECGDVLGAVNLCIVVLSIVLDVLQYCDDSNGQVGSVINRSIELINEAVNENCKDLAPVEQKRLFTMIFKEALDKRYDEWKSWRFDLLWTCTNFCGIPELRVILEKQLNEMSKVVALNPYYRSNYLRQTKLLQLEIVTHFDSSEKAEKLIQENIRFSEFREKAIINAFHKGKYEEVLSLCLDGEKIDNDDRLVTKWQKYRYLAYEKLGDIENQRKIALEILFHNEFEFYLKLKKLYQPNEWSIVLEKIISKFKKQAYQPSVYVRILIEEGLTLQLLEYCKQNLSEIENLYYYFIDEYYEATRQLFIEYIKREAKMASNRKKYRKVCGKIRTYKKIFSNIEVDELIDGLKQAHYRQPAFLDELNKVKRR